MTVWNLDGENSCWSEMINEVSKGPQIIALRGIERAVLLSMTDYRALTTQAWDLNSYLLSGPKVDSFEVERSDDTGRILDM